MTNSTMRTLTMLATTATTAFKRIPNMTTATVSALIAAAAACGGNGLAPWGRIAAENVIEVTLDQAAEDLPEVQALVNELADTIEASFDDMRECPPEREALFEMSGYGIMRTSGNAADDRAWERYISLLTSCSNYTNGILSVSSTRRRIQTFRDVYRTERIENTISRMRELLTPARIQRTNTDLERLSQENLATRWNHLHYVAYQRSYGFRTAGGLDTGTWLSLDTERVTHVLNQIAKDASDRVFDIEDTATEAEELYERMQRGEHR